MYILSALPSCFVGVQDGKNLTPWLQAPTPCCIGTWVPLTFRLTALLLVWWTFRFFSLAFVYFHFFPFIGTDGGGGGQVHRNPLSYHIISGQNTPLSSSSFYCQWMVWIPIDLLCTVRLAWAGAQFVLRYMRVLIGVFLAQRVPFLTTNMFRRAIWVWM